MGRGYPGNVCAEWVVIADGRGSIARAVVNDVNAQAAMLALFIAGFIVVGLPIMFCHVHFAMLGHVATGL